MTDEPKLAQTKRSPSTEVSLMDIWIILIAHRVLAISIFGAVIAVGIGMAFNMAPQHRFTTVIEIGEVRADGEVVPIESARTAVAKLRDRYFPSVVTRLNSDEVGAKVDYKFDVAGSRESRIVEMTSKGARDKSGAHTTLHEKIVDSLLQDHDLVVKAGRDNAELLVAKNESELFQLDVEIYAATEQKKILTSAISDARDQIKDTDRRLTQVETRLSDMRNDGVAADAPSAFLLSQHIDALTMRKMELEEKVLVHFPLAKSQIQARLTSASRQKETALRTLQFHKAMSEGVRATRVLNGIATMSVHPITPNKLVVVLVSIIVGLAVALGAALVADFFVKARKSVRT